MSIHVAVGLVPVKRFDHEGLHQFHIVDIYSCTSVKSCQHALTPPFSEMSFSEFSQTELLRDAPRLHSAYVPI